MRSDANGGHNHHCYRDPREGNQRGVREKLCRSDTSLTALERIDPRKCKAVELRYFGELSKGRKPGAPMRLVKPRRCRSKVRTFSGTTAAGLPAAWFIAEAVFPESSQPSSLEKSKKLLTGVGSWKELTGRIR
jgi:hypothetical protein